jgi:hypothetical protein
MLYKTEVAFEFQASHRIPKMRMRDRRAQPINILLGREIKRQTL